MKDARIKILSMSLMLLLIVGMGAENAWSWCVNRDTDLNYGSCSGTDCQVDCCSGTPMSWPGATMTYHIINQTPSALRPLLQQGMQKWDSVQMSTFTFPYGGISTKTSADAGVNDGFNIVGIDPLCRTNGVCGAFTLAVSMCWSTPTTKVDCDVVFNGENINGIPITWGDGTGGTKDTIAVMAHEAGHNAGITHPGSTCRKSGSAGCGPEFQEATMYWAMSDAESPDKQSLELDDMASLVYIYPRSTLRVKVMQGGSPVSGATVELVGTSAPIDGTSIAEGGIVKGDVSNLYLFGNKASSLTYNSSTPFSNTNASGYTNYINPMHQSFSVRVTKGTDTVTQPVTAADGTSTVIVTFSSPEPEMDVQGNSVSITDGDTTPSTTDGTDFGPREVGGPTIAHNFLIQNTGDAVLNLTGTPRVAVSGPHAADFIVTVQPNTPINPSGASTVFIVVFNPSAAGLRSATLSIANNDADENPYNFDIQGTGTQQPVNIVIEKQTNPAGGTGFGFTGSGPSPITPFTLDGGQSNYLSNLQAGTYTVLETTMPPGWTLNSVQCESGSGISWTPITGGVEITLDPGTGTHCVFNNEGPPPTGTIVIVKDSIPDSPQDFNFSTTGGLSPATFTLDDDADGTLPNTQTFNTVNAGAYTVSEAAEVGYTTSVSCVDPDNGSTTAGSTATIDLDPGETITCTFTNTAQPGTITVVKQVVGDPPATDWSFTGSGSIGNFILPAAGGQQVFSGLAADAYTISETPQPGYTASVSCTSGDTGIDSVTVNLSVGGNITCTFVNTQDSLPTGKIIIEKQTNPDGSTESFEFEPSYGSNFFLSDGQTHDSGQLPLGTYQVREIPPPGWTVSNVNCVCNDCQTWDQCVEINSSGICVRITKGVSINLQADETVTCTFNNEGPPQPGTIIVEKQTDPDGAPYSFTFSGDASGSIMDGEQIVVSNLPPGAYTSQETVPAGWELIAIVCDDDNSTVSLLDRRANFQLEAGETVKCTFYNRLPLDYGDVPDSYGTLLASNGARHAIVPGHSLGPIVDAEPDGQPSPLADGDDLNPSGAPDDEDGMTLPPFLTAGAPDVVIVDGGPSGGMLDAWIDFNGNGLFDHPVEHLWGGGSQPLMPGPNHPPLSFPVPATAVPGPTYARFRLSMNGNLPPIGFAPDGEVEDYRVQIEAPQTGEITAHKFNDLNGNGVLDAGEPALSGWTMTLYNNADCDLNGRGQVKEVGVTDGDGNMVFTDLPAADYSVAETLQAGWENTTDLCQNVTLAAGVSETIHFGNRELPPPGTITAHKFNDQNGNGVLDVGEPGLSGWTMTLYNGPGCDAFNGRDLAEGVTDGDGNMVFTDLTAGDYSVAETLQAGWLNTTDLCQDVTLVAGGSEIVNFGNQEQTGTIIIKKQTDPAGAPETFRFTASAPLAPATFDLLDGGSLTFDDVQAGQYDVTEVVPAGWLLDSITCDDPSGGTTVSGTTASIDLDAGETVTCTFINTPDGELTIDKAQSLDGNSWTFDTLEVSRGDSIFYELTVENTFNYAIDLVISDTLDNLLVYQRGSLYVDNVLTDDSTIYSDLTNTLAYYTQLAGNSTLTLTFEVKVVDVVYPADTLIENFAVLTSHDKKSTTVKARVKDPIPEPATLALLGIGLAGVFALARRRRRQNK